MRISDWSSDVCSSDLGCPVVARDGAVDVAHPAAGLAAQQLADQALADAAAASLRMYCDLPHEEGIRLLRRQIAGDPSDRPAVDLSEGAGAGEVRALQPVAVDRKSKRLTSSHSSAYRQTSHASQK